MPPPASPRRSGPGRRRVARAVEALEQLAGGLGTAALAAGLLALLVLVAVACLGGVGLLAVPYALAALRSLADRERRRLGRWGPPVVGPGALPSGLRASVTDRSVRRELGWLAVHATAGLLVGLVGVLLPLYAVRELTFPLWWRLLPAGDATTGLGGPVVTDDRSALAVAALGLLWAAATVWGTPALARLQAGPGRRWLAPPDGTDLPLRVAELTATRAAALDAHAAELRRIERALHDGTQNRLVAVTVLLGAARRAVTRDAEGAEVLLGRAQDAAELALSELRAVVRTILPPVLDDGGLPAALTGLAAGCPVPCEVEVVGPLRCPASTEATAYFVVAEALTNVARHSGARRVRVQARTGPAGLRLSVTDDGAGGAREGAGSGLTGVRRRVEALDGRLTITSPAGGPTALTVELPCGG